MKSKQAAVKKRTTACCAGCGALVQQTPRIWLRQSASVAPCKGEGVAERSPRSLGVCRYTPAVSLFKSASTVSLLTLASRITGLVRELLMASVFGVSALTDAFNVAFRIPNLFRRVLGEGAFSQLLCQCWPPPARRTVTTAPRC